MLRACELARRGRNDTPNPQVGCVIIDRAGRIVAEGWHDGAGTPHAEAAALQELARLRGLGADGRDADRGSAVDKGAGSTAGENEAGLDPRELTAVVTLEPCNHTGRTGPCAKALLAAGIGAVVYGSAEPGAVAGGGAAALAEAGVRVHGGVCRERTDLLVADWRRRVGADAAGAVFDAGSSAQIGQNGAHTFFTASAAIAETASGGDNVSRETSPAAAGYTGSVINLPAAAGDVPHLAATGFPGATADFSSFSAATNPATRPYVIAKWAQSVCGRAFATDGSNRWLTGPAARADVHARRSKAVAIAAGTGTILADDPALTARDAAGELLVPAAQQPAPVIFGTRQIPASAQVFTHPALAARSLTAPLQYTGRDLAADLADIAARGYTSLFVEGGPTLISALLAADLVDECLIYIAPTLLGGPGTALGEIAVPTLAAGKTFTALEHIPLGRDLLLRGLLRN
ncbi:MAG: dihydrofolate reductase family protein [Microbacteriaceae bacterium]|nr:dihydrofolate reductase family protein [Microbacteriaceae bacterium]